VSAGPYESLNLGLHVGDDPASVLENRTRAAAAVGVELDDLVLGRQAHGRAVATVGRAERGRGARSDDTAIADTDALVTAAPGIGLVAMVADCVPIVLVDPVASVLGCVHAGWRGTVARVAQATVDQMVALGAEPSRLVVGIGPAIPADRYQVGAEVVDAASAALGPHTERVVRADGTGRWRFDVRTANQLVLADAGVDPANIHLAAVGSDSDDFFSDRAVRPCGRFAAIARLLP
jgi:YfiH family protein